MHYFMNSYYYSKYGFQKNESNSRSLSRVNDILLYLDALNMCDIKNKEEYVYVDIGCSEGGITQFLGKSLGLNHVYGVDIVDESKITRIDDNNDVHMEYIKLDMTKHTEYCLPFLDESVDLITILMCLHHINKNESCIKEISRTMKKGGYLIVQEHDAQTKEDKICLDILHGMYSIVWNEVGKVEDPNFCETYESFYKSRKEWTELILSNGFEEISDLKINEKKIRGIPRNNIHHNYWAIYRKI